MSILSNVLYEKSISCALSAIEIYNKPDFKQRSEVFSILMVNAWESLLKAKIIKQNGESIESIYIYDNNSQIKKNRSGHSLTLEVIGCARLLSLETIVIDNLTALIEVRDNSIHFVNSDSVDFLVFTLGMASVRNYYKLTKEWFGDSIDKYNFSILPLSFVQDFKTIKLLELVKEPKIIQDLILKIDQQQSQVNKTPFHFVCEIEIVLKSAKKVTESTDLVVNIEPTISSHPMIIRDVDVIEKYPYTATDLFKKVKKEIKDLNRNDFFRYLREAGLRDDPRYSSYLFRNIRQKKKYENDCIAPSGISSLYNQECFLYLIAHYPRGIIYELNIALSRKNK